MPGSGFIAGGSAAERSGPRVRTTLFLCLLILLVRLAVPLVLGNTIYFVDEADYLTAADNLRAGNGFGDGYDRVPAYPLFLAGLTALVPNDPFSIRLGQAVMTVGGGAILVGLAASMFGSTVAVVAGLLYALDPLLVVSAGLLYPEAITAVVLIATLALMIRASRENRLLFSLGVGVLIASLVQLRPISAVMLPVALVWLISTGQASLGRKLQHALVVCLATVLLMVPWAIRTHHVYGRWTPLPTKGLPVVSQAEAGEGEHAHWSFLVRVVEEAQHDPGRFIRKLAVEFFHFFEPYPMRLASDQPDRVDRMRKQYPDLATIRRLPREMRTVVSALSFGSELTLAIIGICIGWRTNRSATVLLAGTILLHAAGYSIVFGRTRYRIPILPCMFIFSAVGFTWLGGFVSTKLQVSLPVRGSSH